MTNHKIHDCKKFTSQNHSDKIEYIKGQGRCYSCLEKGHLANNCQARSECKKCHRKHPTRRPTDMMQIPGFILLQAYKKLSLFMTILAKKNYDFFMTSAIFWCRGLMFSNDVTH